MNAIPALVASTLAQRETRLTYVCACGEVVYGDAGRGWPTPTCALCALKDSMKDAEACAWIESAVAKFSETPGFLRRNE